MVKTCLLVGIGGGIGSILRFLTTYWLSKWNTSFFPWGTFTVNMIGSFLAGLLLSYFIMRSSDAAALWKLFLITGLCGGYTTFSAFHVDNLQLMQSGQYGVAFVYISVSLMVGLFAVYLGYTVGHAALL